MTEPLNQAKVREILARAEKAKRLVSTKEVYTRAYGQSLGQLAFNDVPDLADTLEEFAVALRDRHNRVCGDCYEDGAIGAKKQPCKAAALIKSYFGGGSQ